MSGLFGRRHLGRGHRTFFNRVILGLFLLVTQGLVQDLLAQNHYEWEALAETCSVSVDSGQITGMGVRLEDGKTIATCAHVVGSNRWVSVNGSKSLVLAKDTDNDIAIIRTRDPGMPFETQWGIEPPAMGTGIVMAARLQDGQMRIHRTTVLGSGPKENSIAGYLAQKGYSGGPVFTPEGKLLGIIRGEAFVNGLSGTDFIPIWKVRELINNTRDRLNCK